LKAYWQCFRRQHWLFPASNNPQLAMNERVPKPHWRILNALLACRTPALDRHR
jgi:hypothetical protein